MICPQCGAETPDDAMNCVSCQINLYWAGEHYRSLASLREREGLPAGAMQSPEFLVRAHDEAVAERRRHPAAVAQKVRTFARRPRDGGS